MKRTNTQFLVILGITLAFNLLFMAACAVADAANPPTPPTPDTVIFPNWKEADQLTGIEDRYTDTWCEIAYNRED